MPATLSTSVTAERGSRVQNTNALATEWVVVSFWQPKSGIGEGDYDHKTFKDEDDARNEFRDLERGEYPRARAVCIFASRHGVPIGRIA